MNIRNYLIHSKKKKGFKLKQKISCWFILKKKKKSSILKTDLPALLFLIRKKNGWSTITWGYSTAIRLMAIIPAERGSTSECTQALASTCSKAALSPQWKSNGPQTTDLRETCKSTNIFTFCFENRRTNTCHMQLLLPFHQNNRIIYSSCWQNVILSLIYTGAVLEMSFEERVGKEKKDPQNRKK